jgi:hypothetical protein
MSENENNDNGNNPDKKGSKPLNLEVFGGIKPLTSAQVISLLVVSETALGACACGPCACGGPCY